MNRGEHRLSAAEERDFDELMTWFPTAAATNVWGGPMFRFPFSRDSFIEDCHWPDIKAFVLRDTDQLIGFGQVYERYERINLARLAVNPARRGEGFGSRLVAALMREALRYFDNSEYSLFVYRDNAAALACYRSAGFELADYPQDAPLADRCYYLIRPVERRR